VEKSVKNAIRVKKIQQIVNGSGVDQMLGIVNAPVSMIPANCTKTITSIDENTLEEIIFEYGGDENVEGDAFIILNKLTLKEFSKVKGTDKKRAYDIVVRGNAGTINGIPFVCTSAVSAYKNDLAAGVPYLIYGKLAGYVLAEFSNIEVEKSTDYKFKQGMIAYRAEQMVGGSPAMYKGFMKVQRAAAN
jgi:HK97 family phage major capsid protein